MDNILCKTCVFWVDCNNENSFCLVRDLFTPTFNTKCRDYKEGNPMTEKEYEEWNAEFFN